MHIHRQEKELDDSLVAPKKFLRPFSKSVRQEQHAYGKGYFLHLAFYMS